ncbi:MAG: hypothetical protein H6739_27005 [Alphaproteobacteria bacterium]|nr:hypothetical protein [Alphaproteobacteria bacterium]
MSLPSQFQRLTLSEVSLRLGIHPFDLIRVLVALDEMPDDLTFSEEDVDRIRERGGLETWWIDDAPAEQVRHDDPVPVRGMARAMAMQLIAHKVLGRATTRLDNLIRGLEPESQVYARNVLSKMLQEGYLQTFNTPSGLNISVVSNRAEDLRRIAGGDYPREMKALWEG